jgi:hypothetical protein
MSCDCGFYTGERGECVCGKRWSNGRDKKSIKE